jgi:hypothetical protein
MPHEKIWDAHNRSALPGEEVQPDQNALDIGWSPDALGDGWVQVSARRMIDARQSALIENTPDMVLEAAVKLVDQRMQECGFPTPAKACQEIAAALLPQLAYAVGPRVEQLAIQLDRTGCNRTIRVLRRARDAAYGKDE